MISILQRPAPLALSGNPIDIEVLASRADGSPAISLGGSRAVLSGLQGQGLGSNVFFSINWTRPDGVPYSVNFSTAGPFASAYGIPAYSSGNLAQYWRDLATAVGGNQEISPWFYVASQRNGNGTYGITVSARSIDPAWDIQFGPTSSSNFTVQNSLPGVEDIGFRIRVEIFMERNGRYGSIGQFGTPPNAESRASFDISGLIRDAIEEVLPVPGVPAFNLSEPIVASNIFAYYLRISSYTETDGYTSGVLIEDREAFAGAVGGALDSATFFETLTEESSWLTARPDRRSVGMKEPVFLSWIKPSGAGASVGLEIKETKQDGTQATKTLFSGTPAVDFNPITFPVGVVALAISEETLYYEIRVSGLAAPTPWRTFIVDRKEYESERYLIYLNSFYLPEVLRCTGDVTHQMSVSYQTYQRIRPLNGGRLVPGRGNHATDTEEEYLFRTGYKPREEINAVLRELVASPRVYDYAASNAVPLLSTGTGFALSTTGQNLFSASLPFELAPLEKGSAFGNIGNTIVGDGLNQPDNGGITDPNEPDGGGGGDSETNLFAWQGADGENWTSDDGTPWTTN